MSAVIGVPDEAAGEVPKAFIVLRPGARARRSRNCRHSWASHVASYKQMREIEVVEAIPKSASGKILRRELRKRAA